MNAGAPPATAAGREVRFERLRRPELDGYASSDAVVLIPIGAVEQHGPHLPVETDTFAATACALECARSFDDVLVAPAIPWGLSHGHAELGGTLTLRPSTLLDLGVDLMESLVNSGFPRIVWVNGHAGNRPALGLLVYEAKRQWGLSVAALTYYELAAERFVAGRASALGGAGHACEFETSLMLHLDADRVGDASAVCHPVVPLTSHDFQDITVSGPAQVGFTFAERFPDGVAGEPGLATPELGRDIFRAACAALSDFVRELKSTPLFGALPRD